MAKKPIPNPIHGTIQEALDQHQLRMITFKREILQPRIKGVNLIELTLSPKSPQVYIWAFCSTVKQSFEKHDISTDILDIVEFKGLIYIKLMLKPNINIIKSLVHLLNR